MTPGRPPTSHHAHRLEGRRATGFGALAVALLVAAGVITSGLPGASAGGSAPAAAEARAKAGSSGAVPSRWRRSATFEKTLARGTDGWRRNSPFNVSKVRASRGRAGHAARIVTHGGSIGCSCPRMTYDGFSLGPGDEVWTSGSWRIPNPSKLAWSRLMNLAHWEPAGGPDNWVLALLVRESGMSVQARSYQSEEGVSVLMPAHPIPDNRWFRVDIHFVLSPTDGLALTEVYLDGRLVSFSTNSNMWAPTPLTFYNAGIPYFWPENGDTTVFFDRPRLTF